MDKKLIVLIALIAVFMPVLSVGAGGELGLESEDEQKEYCLVVDKGHEACAEKENIERPVLHKNFFLEEMGVNVIAGGESTEEERDSVSESGDDWIAAEEVEKMACRLCLAKTTDEQDMLLDGWLVEHTIDEQDPRDGNTLLQHVMNKYGCWKTSLMLVARGACVLQRGDEDETLFDLAIQDNDVAVIEQLIKAGILSREDDTQRATSYLTDAIWGGDTKIIQLLVNNFGSLNNVDFLGMTPLLAAVQCQDVETVGLLISRKADVNMANRATQVVDIGQGEAKAVQPGDTPLIFAARHNDDKLMLGLIMGGADCSSVLMRADISEEAHMNIKEYLRIHALLHSKKTGVENRGQLPVDKRSTFCVLGCDKEKSLQKCSGCQAVYYCSPLCQKKHWPQHKLECKKRVSIGTDGTLSAEHKLDRRANFTEKSRAVHSLGMPKSSVRAAYTAGLSQKDNDEHDPLEAIRRSRQVEQEKKMKVKSAQSADLVRALNRYDAHDKSTWLHLRSLVEQGYCLYGDDKQHQSALDAAVEKLFSGQRSGRFRRVKCLQDARAVSSAIQQHTARLGKESRHMQKFGYQLKTQAQQSQKSENRRFARQGVSFQCSQGAYNPELPVPSITAAERRIWVSGTGEGSKGITAQGAVAVVGKSNTVDEQDAKTSRDDEAVGQRQYSELFSISSYGTFLLDYSHLFEGEGCSNDTGGFHHDYREARVNDGTLRKLDDNFEGMRNGCYKCVFVMNTNGQVQSKIISLFPSHWTRESLLERLRDAFTSGASPLIIYEDREGDTCIVGQLLAKVGDRGDLISGTLHLPVVYFKAIVKRDMPGVVRTVYPITQRVYERDCKRVRGI